MAVWLVVHGGRGHEIRYKQLPICSACRPIQPASGDHGRVTQ